MRFADTPGLSPQRAFGIAQGLLRAYQRAPQRHPVRPYPHGLFSFRAAQFSAFTLWLSFYAVFPYEKRSAVSFPPDVAPSKDTGEHWTLLHEIYSYIYVCSASTFFEQLSIFDCDPLKALVAVKACSEEREITRTVKKAKTKASFIFLLQSGL